MATLWVTVLTTAPLTRATRKDALMRTLAIIVGAALLTLLMIAVAGNDAGAVIEVGLLK